MTMNMRDFKDLMLPGVRAAEVKHFNGGDINKKKDWDNDVEIDLQIIWAEDRLELSAYDPKSRVSFKEKPPEFTRQGIENGLYKTRFFSIMEEFCNNAKVVFNKVKAT